MTQGERDAIRIEHFLTGAQHLEVSLLGLHRQAGLQMNAAKPSTSRALFPRRARGLERVTVGSCRRGRIAPLHLLRFAFTLPALEHGRRRRHRAIVLPRRDHAVVHHRGHEDNR